MGPTYLLVPLLPSLFESLRATLAQEVSFEAPCPEIPLFPWFLASAHLAHIKQMVP